MARPIIREANDELAQFKFWKGKGRVKLNDESAKEVLIENERQATSQVKRRVAPSFNKEGKATSRIKRRVGPSLSKEEKAASQIVRRFGPSLNEKDWQWAKPNGESAQV